MFFIIGFIKINDMSAEEKETGLARVFGLILITILIYFFSKWKKELDEYSGSL